MRTWPSTSKKKNFDSAKHRSNLDDRRHGRRQSTLGLLAPHSEAVSGSMVSSQTQVSVLPLELMHAEIRFLIVGILAVQMSVTHRYFHLTDAVLPLAGARREPPTHASCRPSPARLNESHPPPTSASKRPRCARPSKFAAHLLGSRWPAPARRHLLSSPGAHALRQSALK